MDIKKEFIKSFKTLLGLYFEKVYTDSEVKISDKSIGSKVEMIGADGSLSDAPDGDYVMDNGFSFTVKGGMIESIVGEEAPVEAATDSTDATSGDTATTEVETPAEDAAPEEEPTEEEAPDEMDMRVKALEDKVAELVDMIAGMAEQKMEADKTIEAFTAEVKSLNNNIQTLAKVPVEFSKTNTKKVVEESKEEQLLNVARMLGGLTNKK